MPYRKLIAVSEEQLRAALVRTIRRNSGGRPWTEVEPEARSAYSWIIWSDRRPWEAVREEIRRAWEKEPSDTAAGALRPHPPARHRRTTVD